MLLQLPALPQVPGAHGVVQAARPQLGAVVRDVDAAGSVRVTLELPARTQHATGEAWSITHQSCLRT